MILLGCGLWFSPGSVGFTIRSSCPIRRVRKRNLSPSIILSSALSGRAIDLTLPNHVRKWLDLELPEGRCVGISMSDVVEGDLLSENNSFQRQKWMQEAFHPDELVYGNSLSGARAESYWLGRLAMRIALDFPEYPILKDPFGRPSLHGKVLGSISHKGNCGIALVSQGTSKVAGIGIDLEFTSRPGKRSIAPRVLTPHEQRSLGNLPGVSAEEEVLLRFRYATLTKINFVGGIRLEMGSKEQCASCCCFVFFLRSLKEAIYKAVHPHLCQYIGFQEAEVTPNMDGTASCTWFLESNKENDAVLRSVSAHWRRLDEGNFFLTSASVKKEL